MNDMPDAEWSKQVQEIGDEVIKIIEGKQSGMILEVLSSIIAEVLDPLEETEGIPLMLSFLGSVLEKRYDLGFDLTKIESGMMQ
jgi:hypothetical protein